MVGKSPFVTMNIAMNSPKLTVWRAISSKQIIEPFFYDETVNQHTYLDMVQNFFFQFYRKNSWPNQSFFNKTERLHTSQRQILPCLTILSPTGGLEEVDQYHAPLT